MYYFPCIDVSDVPPIETNQAAAMGSIDCVASAPVQRHITNKDAY